MISLIIHRERGCSDRANLSWRAPSAQTFSDSMHDLQPTLLLISLGSLSLEVDSHRRRTASHRYSAATGSAEISVNAGLGRVSSSGAGSIEIIAKRRDSSSRARVITSPAVWPSNGCPIAVW